MLSAKPGQRKTETFFRVMSIGILAMLFFTALALPAYSGETLGGSSSEGPGEAGEMVTAASLKSSFPIVEPFKQHFDKCTEQIGLGNCKFQNKGIMGDAAHQARASCHNTGDAIDVGKLECATGGNVEPKDEKFGELAKCMANKTEDKFKVLFSNIPDEPPNLKNVPNHDKHMHIQNASCKPQTGSGG